MSARRVLLTALLVVAPVLVTGCGDDDAPTDAGGTDGNVGGPCSTDTDCPGSYCNMGMMLCCAPASPPYELCGDRIDQNCDRRDQSCGDNDFDGSEACRPGEDPTSGSCDCDDERPDVRPPVGSLPGAFEECDGIDNDCNGRVDEAAQCCDACAFLGDARDRADVCREDGVCDCSTVAGDGPCDEGMTCCSTGCLDVQTDLMNCGFCGAQCTVSSDRCVAGACQCGDGPPCELDLPCVGGVCQMMM